MLDALRQQKAVIRQEMLAKRDALDPAGRAAKSQLIKTYFFSLPEILAAKSLMFYVSFRSEVETHIMIKYAMAIGMKVIVPKTDTKNKQLILYRLENYEEDLSPGVWGIMEPKAEKLSPVSYDEIDVVIAPGVAFSEQGWRIGYGGGFYDRLLRESQKRSYALGFEMQVLPEIPFDPQRDVPVNYLVTERRVITCDTVRQQAGR
jgi:5-formyltetrahydrofolate cyclo-ligase